MNVELQYFDSCPNWLVMQQNLQDLSSEFPEMKVTLQTVESPDEASRLSFHGSPSIVVDGVDPFADASTSVGYSCRVYETPDGMAGAPTPAQLREVFRTARS